MKNLLRPNQIEEFKHQEQILEKKLKNDNIEDKTAVKKQLKRLRYNLESQTPAPVIGEEKDALVKKNKELLESILVGMPSQAEMRRCPPGAVDKHLSWERRNKLKITEWKNNQLRINHGTDQQDIANLEMYRPIKSTLNLENSYIEGANINIPDKVGYCSPYTDEEIRLIRQRAPSEVWQRLPVMTADERSILRQVYIDTWEDKPEIPEPASKREKAASYKSPEVAKKLADEAEKDIPKMDLTQALSDIWTDEK